MTTSSPDRSVRIMVDQAGRIDVEVAEVRGQTEESLGRQVAATARIALAALQRVELEEPPPPVDPSQRWRQSTW